MEVHGKVPLTAIFWMLERSQNISRRLSG